MILLMAAGAMIVMWVIISCFAWWSREDYKGYGILYKGEITTNFNAIPFARNSRKFISKKWQDVKPKSGIDKEIAEEEKEIAELEQQKEKIDTLAELKLRKDRLFKDAHRDKKWTVEVESYRCYKCDRYYDGLDNFYKHRLWDCKQ